VTSVVSTGSEETPVVTFAAVWRNFSLDDVKLIFNAVYEEVAHWRTNLYLLPTGKAGKDFIDEYTRLIHEWTNNSPLRTVTYILKL